MIDKIKKLAIQAGKATLAYYGQPQTTYKDDRSPLTKADTEANRIITSFLREHFPNHGILTEEEKDTSDRLNKEYVWIIDPLDGTKEFIKKNGEFTINIALTKQGEPILGVIYAPALDLLFSAEQEKGAFCNDEPIHVSKKTKHLVLAQSRSHADGRLKQLPIETSITSGSSLKGCLIAQGKADCYVRFGPVNEWDICAMHCIVTEAGGTLKTLLGNRIVFNQKETLINGFMATNGSCEPNILDAVQKIQND